MYHNYSASERHVSGIGGRTIGIMRKQLDEGDNLDVDLAVPNLHDMLLNFVATDAERSRRDILDTLRGKDGPSNDKKGKVVHTEARRVANESLKELLFMSPFSPNTLCLYVDELQADDANEGMVPKLLAEACKGFRRRYAYECRKTNKEALTIGEQWRIVSPTFLQRILDAFFLRAGALKEGTRALLWSW
jgi:hypothetical protein